MNLQQMTTAKIQEIMLQMQNELDRRERETVFMEMDAATNRGDEFFKNLKNEDRWDWNNPVTQSEIECARGMLQKYPENATSKRVLERAELFGIVPEQYECNHCQDGIGKCEVCMPTEE